MTTFVELPILDAKDSVVLSDETLKRIAHDILDAATADATLIGVHHRADGITRLSNNRLRLVNTGDIVRIRIRSSFGTKNPATIVLDRIDRDSLRDAVRYNERVAREMPGDIAPSEWVMPVRQREYNRSTVWHESTASAILGTRVESVPALLQSMMAERLRASAFVGVYAHAKLFVSKQGLLAVSRETDAEMTVMGWSPNDASTLGSPGWAGQASREWTQLDPSAIGTRAAKLTMMAANPVAVEPGRHLAILDRAAVLQLVGGSGGDFSASATHMGLTPLSGMKIGQRIFDDRLTLSSDPGDPEGGYMPVSDNGSPLSPMSWVTDGRLANLAYSPLYAATNNIPVSNDPPASLRLQANGAKLTVEEMIANAKQAIYVNRFSNIIKLDPKTGIMTGVTQGGCFLVKNGKIEKAIKDFRFVESLYYVLNRVRAVGKSQRTAVGYAPHLGAWPIAPIIVPPLMIEDFNFVGLAEAI